MVLFQADTWKRAIKCILLFMKDSSQLLCNLGRLLLRLPSLRTTVWTKREGKRGARGEWCGSSLFPSRISTSLTHTQPLESHHTPTLEAQHYVDYQVPPLHYAVRSYRETCTSIAWIKWQVFPVLGNIAIQQCTRINPLAHQYPVPQWVSLGGVKKTFSQWSCTCINTCMKRTPHLCTYSSCK